MAFQILRTKRWKKWQKWKMLKQKQQKEQHWDLYRCKESEDPGTESPNHLEEPPFHLPPTQDENRWKKTAQEAETPPTPQSSHTSHTSHTSNMRRRGISMDYIKSACRAVLPCGAWPAESLKADLTREIKIIEMAKNDGKSMVLLIPFGFPDIFQYFIPQNMTEC